jgi:hypothetical protein
MKKIPSGTEFRWSIIIDGNRSCAGLKLDWQLQHLQQTEVLPETSQRASTCTTISYYPARYLFQSMSLSGLTKHVTLMWDSRFTPKNSDFKIDYIHNLRVIHKTFCSGWTARSYILSEYNFYLKIGEPILSKSSSKSVPLPLRDFLVRSNEEQ